MTGLNYYSLPKEIQSIGAKAMGRNVLLATFKDGITYHLMMKFQAGKPAGFALYHFETEYILDKAYTLGVIDCICLNYDMIDDGTMKLLLFNTARKMSSLGCNRVETFLKETPEGKMSTQDKMLLKTLKRMGFEEVGRRRDYYKEESVAFDTHCATCRRRVDNCVGILYAAQELDLS